MKKLKDILCELMPLCSKGYNIFIWDETCETFTFVNTLDELIKQYPNTLKREVVEMDVDDDCEIIHVTLKDIN